MPGLRGRFSTRGAVLLLGTRPLTQLLVSAGEGRKPWPPLQEPDVDGGMGVEEPVSGMFVSSVCIVTVCEGGTTRGVTATRMSPATAEGAIRTGIESSIGWKLR